MLNASSQAYESIETLLFRNRPPRCFKSLLGLYNYTDNLKWTRLFHNHWKTRFDNIRHSDMGMAVKDNRPEARPMRTRTTGSMRIQQSIMANRLFSISLFPDYTVPQVISIKNPRFLLTTKNL